MNATDHQIEHTEEGLAFCTRCKGGEIELEESCLSRLESQNEELRQEIVNLKARLCDIAVLCEDYRPTNAFQW